MKFKELSKKWKVIIIILTMLTLLFASLIGVFSVFLHSYRKTNADARALLKKSDSELIGTRSDVPRGKKNPVSVNLYFPDKTSEETLPVVFNIHGGGFVGGDADVLDTQSNRIANEWNVIVVTVNYTKADVKSVTYGAEEIKDTILYFADNAETYHADKTRFSLMGYSAGAYYSAEAIRLLVEENFSMESLILCYPWTTGLSADDLNKDWPATLYVLAGQDQISQNSKT